jgi:hypothetical protein
MRQCVFQESDVPHITLNDDQMKNVSEAKQPIEIRDRSGRRLGFVAHTFTQQDIAIARQRMESNQPRFSTTQVLKHLRSIDQK